jgi:plasmid stabilization system protein ParE
MTYRVVIQPRVEQDIRNSMRWILERSKSPATALRWTRGIRAKIVTLKTSPLSCPIDPDSEAFGVEVRLLLFGRGNSYKVLFCVEGDTVHVLAVRHTAQNDLAHDQNAGQGEF